MFRGMYLQVSTNLSRCFSIIRALNTDTSQSVFRDRVEVLFQALADLLMYHDLILMAGRAFVPNDGWEPIDGKFPV